MTADLAAEVRRLRSQLEPIHSGQPVAHDYIPNLTHLHILSDDQRKRAIILIDAGRLADAVGVMIDGVAAAVANRAGSIVAAQRKTFDMTGAVERIVQMVTVEIYAKKRAPWPKPQAAVMERHTGRRGLDRPLLTAWPKTQLMVQLLVAAGAKLTPAKKAMKSWPHKDARGRRKKT